jgi:hypothetical protein
VGSHLRRSGVLACKGTRKEQKYLPQAKFPQKQAVTPVAAIPVGAPGQNANTAVCRRQIRVGSHLRRSGVFACKGTRKEHKLFAVGKIPAICEER